MFNRKYGMWLTMSQFFFKMIKYILEHNRKKCIGCGACTIASPKYFFMDSDGQANLLIKENEKLELDNDIDDNKRASESCPVNCIKVIEN